MRAIFVLLALTTGLAAQTDCSVDGNVTNGVTGEPVPRARITLRSPGGQSSASADNSGHWSFSNVACGRVQIMGNRPGFLARASGPPFGAVVLSSGAPVHDVKIQLTPQAVIVGKVVDDQGDPIVNVNVIVLASRVVEGRRTFQQTGGINTNDLGEFRLASLTGGRYIVCARSYDRGPGGDSQTLGENCYPGPAEGGAASAMELAAGHETRVDFTLREVPTAHVRGTITGMPKTQGAGISMVKRGGNAGGVRQARIGPDGKFDVAGVTPGSYLLSTDYFEAGSRLSARVPVEVGTSDVDDVAVHLNEGFTVTGRVRIESKSGSAPANRQFALSLRAPEPMVGSGQIKWGADNATFTIPDLTPGIYLLNAFPPAPFFVKSATLGGRDIMREEIPITQAGDPIEIVLGDDSGVIDALVTGADDQPAASSMAMLLQDGLRPRISAAGADGHVKMQGLAPGDYRIYAWDDIAQVEYADADWMKRYGGGGVTVTVQAGQTAQVTVKQQLVPVQ